ncbi:MAG TPA: hypothetical protein VHS34_12025 [Terriglobales bacterium]|jgi:hypothetical protein|nr:hypothetical protein [Terriglobales bacterium]
MNCAEFQEFLPDVIDGDRTVEQEAHLKSCSMCAELVAELNLIAREAPQLQEFAEPSPRVWNSIELALRREGLIHEPVINDPRPGLELVPPVKRGWTLSWLVPVAAMAVLAFGVFVYQRNQPIAQPPQVASSVPAPGTSVQTPQNPKNVNNTDDQQLLDAVGSRSPAMQAQYASNLSNVNAYIRDAEESAQADPNDEEAQQIVMDAYEQRAAVYELALDRTLP